MRRFALVAFLAGCSAMAFAAGSQLLTLRDGRAFSGTMTSGNSQYLIFRDDSGVQRRFNVNEVQSLGFGYSGNSVFGTTSGTYRNDSYSNTHNDPYSANRSYSSADTRMLPAGTQISVRTNEDINSGSASRGRTFSAQINGDVVDETGAVAIPRGSNAQLVIRDESGGGIRGSNLVLDLQSVTANGRAYMVSTEDVTERSDRGIGANRRTATMVGGGAALGTLIGAVAGGGKGALLGAIAGAVAGGAAQVLTKGDTVRVPAETLLTFRLDQPVRLQAYR